MRWLFLLLICFPACRAAHELDALPHRAQPVIGFLSFRMHEPRAGMPEIRLLSYERIDGRFKRESGHDNLPNRITVFLLRDDRLIDSIQIPHPLIRQAEFPDEHGHYTSVPAMLDSADFFIRIQAENRPNELRFIDYRHSKPALKLNTLNLPTS